MPATDLSIGQGRVTTGQGRASAGVRLAGASVVARLCGWWRDASCRLKRHTRVLRFDAGRMWLHCQDCGDSPGWTLDGPKPKPLFTGHIAPTVATTVTVRTKRLRKPKSNLVRMAERKRA